MSAPLVDDVGGQYAARIRALHAQLGIPSGYAAQRRLVLQPEAAELVSVGPDVFDRAQRLTAATSAAWAALRAAALDDGIILLMVSGFRSVDRQHWIFARKLAMGQTLEQILTVNAAPGYSEHHTGRAIDLTSTGTRPLVEEFESSPAFAWLTRYGARFGFRLSYPRDNPFGVIYEPWHWALEG